MSSLQSLMCLTCEVLRCKLWEAHLGTTGNKVALMERLLPSTKQATCTSPSRHDKLFRQAAARNKQQTLHWDTLKEDLLVWCVTNPPFRTRPQSHTNPQIRTSTGASVLQGATTGSSHLSSEHTTHTPSGHEEICPRFNFGKCSEGVIYPRRLSRSLTI